MADITIRTAEVRDANFLSWLILTAGRAHVRKGIWEVILGMPEEQCLHFLRLLSATLVPHLFHHSCYLVADVDSVPRAGLGGYDPNTSGNSALFQALPEVFQRLGGGSPSMSQDGAPPRILNCIPKPVEGVWMIDSVAALPEFRRQGIVSKLLEAVMNRGREKGFRQAQVNIYIGNTSAQRLYEKYGFAILDEMRDPYFEAEIDSPGMARMLRDL
jgi:GNAT superfamily N-acetyltransferase